MFPWGHDRRFNAYPQYFRREFGGRVQKVSVNAGFSCPNRDGTVGKGGCTYCDNRAFVPSYCRSDIAIREQIDMGMEFHRRRYPEADQFLAYFQAYSNTHAPVSELKRIYGQALEVPGIIGLVIGTRPDCLDEEKLDYLEGLAGQVFLKVEIGIESCYAQTLKRINRCHTYRQAEEAILQLAARGIQTGAHLIIGLPGETREMIVEEASRISALPLNSIKLHQLQLIRGTAMEQDYRSHPEDFHFFTIEEYIDLIIKFLERLRPDIVVERFFAEAPPADNVTPVRWNLRNPDLLDGLEQELEARDAWQGKFFIPPYSSTAPGMPEA